jgi:hypothetical protein
LPFASPILIGTFPKNFNHSSSPFCFSGFCRCFHGILFGPPQENVSLPRVLGIARRNIGIPEKMKRQYKKREIEDALHQEGEAPGLERITILMNRGKQTGSPCPFTLDYIP